MRYIHSEETLPIPENGKLLRFLFYVFIFPKYLVFDSRVGNVDLSIWSGAKSCTMSQIRLGKVVKYVLRWIERKYNHNHLIERRYQLRSRSGHKMGKQSPLFASENISLFLLEQIHSENSVYSMHELRANMTLFFPSNQLRSAFARGSSPSRAPEASSQRIFPTFL